MYLVGVTLRWLEYLRYAPEVENVRYAPDTLTLNIIIFNVYTGYPLHSSLLPICYTNEKGTARKKKGCSDTAQISRVATLYPTVGNLEMFGRLRFFC